MFFKDPSTNVAGVKSLSTFKLSQPRSKVKERFVAITVTCFDLPEEVKEPTSDLKKVEKAKCLYCSCSHTFKGCRQFKGKKHKDKILLLGKKGVCLACFHVGHMSRDCERCLTCQVCGQIHPAVLHIKRQSTAQDLKDLKGTI